MKRTLLKVIFAYVIASYAFMLVESSTAVLSGQTAHWVDAIGWPNAMAPVVGPLLLLLALLPSSSHVLGNQEVMERMIVWIIYVGLFITTYGLLCWRNLGYPRRAKYAFAVVATLSLALGASIGVSLQEGRTAEHDYYPQISRGCYVDRNGKVVIPGPFTAQRVFNEGLAAVAVDGKYGFIDLKGEMVIPPQYDEASGFDEGLGRVTLNGKIGFIDRQGHLAIEPQFEDARGFSEGLAAVKQDGKWGYIDVRGQFAIQPRFFEVRSFSEGLAAASSSDGKWGYIDRSGAYVIAPHEWIPWPGEFRLGSARVRCWNRVRRIDWRGEFID